MQVPDIRYFSALSYDYTRGCDTEAPAAQLWTERQSTARKLRWLQLAVADLGAQKNKHIVKLHSQPKCLQLHWQMFYKTGRNYNF
jgi:hypothetical protein